MSVASDNYGELIDHMRLVHDMKATPATEYVMRLAVKAYKASGGYEAARESLKRVLA